MKDIENKKPKYFFYNFAVATGLLPGLLWLRPRRIYSSPAAKERIRGGALIVSNHVSLIDPIYLMIAVWYRRHRFVCMEELLSLPLARAFFKLAGCIPLDRDNTSFDSFREIIDALKMGELVTVFPEGQVNVRSGVVNEFKSGVILMSVMSGKPIIPVYIAKPKRFYDRLTAVIGEAFDPSSVCGKRPSAAQIKELSAMLLEKEKELMHLYKESKE